MGLCGSGRRHASPIPGFLGGTQVRHEEGEVGGRNVRKALDPPRFEEPDLAPGRTVGREFPARRVGLAVPAGRDPPDTLRAVAVVERNTGAKHLAGLVLEEQPERDPEDLDVPDPILGSVVGLHAVVGWEQEVTLAPSDVESVPALLDSSRPEVRGAGLRILIAHAGTSPARASLAQVAADPRELTTLRTMAAGGLGGAGGSALSSLRALLAADDTPAAVRLVAVRALVRVSPDGISDAAAIAGDTTADRLEREVAIQALGTQGESGETALQTLTGASEGWARTAVVAALTATGSPSAVSTFATKLGDPAARLRVFV